MKEKDPFKRIMADIEKRGGRNQSLTRAYGLYKAHKKEIKQGLLYKIGVEAPKARAMAGLVGMMLIVCLTSWVTYNFVFVVYPDLHNMNLRAAQHKAAQASCLYGPIPIATNPACNQ